VYGPPAVLHRHRGHHSANVAAAFRTIKRMRPLVSYQPAQEKLAVAALALMPPLGGGSAGAGVEEGTRAAVGAGGAGGIELTATNSQTALALGPGQGPDQGPQAAV
jgi:hypothetical protein